MAKERHNSKMYAHNVQEIMGCCRAKAIGIINELGGQKNEQGRWCIEDKTFHIWYNSSCRSVVTEGGEPVDIERITNRLNEFAEAHKGINDFVLYNRKDRPNYSLRVYGGDGRETLVSLCTTDKKHARNIEGDIRSRIKQQQIDGIIHYSTKKHFEEWILKQDVKDSSRKRFKAVIDKAAVFMPSMLHKVSRVDVERYKDWLIKEKYAERSIILELDTLQRAFENAIELGYCKKNPCAKVKKPKKPESIVVKYDEDELEAIFREFKRRADEGTRKLSREAWKRYEDVTYGLYYSVLRYSDLSKLECANVSLRFGKIKTIQKKTGKEVIVTIPSLFKQRLQVILSDNPKDLVFKNTNGEKILQTHYDKAIRSVLKSLGIAKKSPIHSFRHTGIQRMVDAGVPISEVAAQAGDTVETIVRNYVKPKAASQESVDRVYFLSAHDNEKCNDTEMTR